MEIFRKILLLTTIQLIVVFNNVSFASNEFSSITITFNQGTDEKYIKLVSLFTGIEIKEKISEDKYIFSIPDLNKSSYVYLLSIIPEVKNITPKLNISLKNKKSGDYVEGLIIVRYKDETTDSQINKIDLIYKTKSTLFSKQLNLYKIKLPISLSINQAVNIFNKLPQVKYAEPDIVMNILKNYRVNISFKETLAKKVFEHIYNLNCISLDSNYCQINLNNNYDSEQIIKSLKLSPYILDVKQVK